MSRRRGLNVNADKKMVLGWEEGLEWCEVYIDRISLEHVSEFKYLLCVLDDSGTNELEGSRRVVSGRRLHRCH